MGHGEAAVAVIHTAGPEGFDIAVMDCHGEVVVECDFAVESIAAEVDEFSAFMEDPAFDAVVHLAGPVFGVSGDDEHAVAGEVKSAVMELCFGVVVEGEVFPFEPAEESPFGGGKVAGLSAFDGVADVFCEVDGTEGFGAFEGEGSIVGVAPCAVIGIEVSGELHAGVDGGGFGELICVDVVAPSAEGIVGVPGDIGCEYGGFGFGLSGSDDPGEGELLTGLG